MEQSGHIFVNVKQIYNNDNDNNNNNNNNKQTNICRFNS